MGTREGPRSGWRARPRAQLIDSIRNIMKELETQPLQGYDIWMDPFTDDAQGWNASSTA
jgi:hypothetical protein